MNIEKTATSFDKNKLNIGSEVECFLVHSNTLKEISSNEANTIFSNLNQKYGWKIHNYKTLKGIQKVTKVINNYLVIIKVDLCYAIFEITTEIPFSDLTLMESVYKQALSELRGVLNILGLMIWPFGVAPASNGFFDLPFKNKEEMALDDFFGPIQGKLDYYERFCHITSCQVTLDLKVEKLIPTINALYKNLGFIIKKFANSPLYVNETLYKEGRYYFWQSYDKRIVENVHFKEGIIPFFPDRPFINLQDFYDRLWSIPYLYLVRNGRSYVCKDSMTTPKQFISQKGAGMLSPDGEEIYLKMEEQDIEMLFNLNWRDFKPHYYLRKFGVEDFISYYKKNDLDGFLKKYTDHSYLEIRPCAPHFEENAMKIPRYFHSLFNNLDQYIKESEKIGWDEAKKLYQKELLI